MSPSASADDLARTFHRLAKLYHPDNPLTGDRERFDLITEAHAALKSRLKREQYDTLDREEARSSPAAQHEAADSRIVGHDVEVQDSCSPSSTTSAATTSAIRACRVRTGAHVRLRHRAPRIPSLVSQEKRWVVRLENGMLGITVEAWTTSTPSITARPQRGS